LQEWYNLVILTRVKTAISLPDDLFAEAERLARELGVPRSRLFADALKEYIRRHRASSITSQLDAVYAIEPSELDPALAGAGLRMLRDAEW
jgi:metal-responsive CopG/Arc/MetJ family transcriptional regulator